MKGTKWPMCSDSLEGPRPACHKPLHQWTFVAYRCRYKTADSVPQRLGACQSPDGRKRVSDAANGELSFSSFVQFDQLGHQSP